MRGPSLGFCKTSNASAGGALCADDVGRKRSVDSNDARQKKLLRQRFTIFHRKCTHRVPTVGLPTLIRESNRRDAGSWIEHGNSHVVVAFGKIHGDVDRTIVNRVTWKPLSHVHRNLDAY